MKLFESVPNFSDGRDPAVLGALEGAARSVAGVSLLDVESNRDHNRSVFSLAGEGAPLSEALFRMVEVAVVRIDLNHHTGEHPRMGAVDVVPIVPLGESSVGDARELAEHLAEKIWTHLGLPVYLYGESARRPERADLAHVRTGGFEGIRDSIATDPARKPDFGEARVHPTAGIVAIGARPLLIAFNAYLATPDVAVAKAIARTIRERDGGLPSVKALGFDIKERGQAQVSMNLTDYHRSGLHTALEAVRREAGRHQTEVVESEIVGLVPEDALLDAADHYLRLLHFDRATILERKLRRAAETGGSSPDDRLANATLTAFAEKLSARTAVPGGGSAAALAGALAASLGEMVVRYSRPKDAEDPEFDDALAELGSTRVRLLDGVDADATAFREVQTTKRERKAHPDDVDARQAHRAALRHAAEVPLDTARSARSIVTLLERLRGRTKTSLASDLTTAKALALAAIEGAVANASINLEELASEGIDIRGLSHELAELAGSPT